MPRKVAAIIVAVSLIISSLPVPFWGSNYLAPPHARTLDDALLEQSKTRLSPSKEPALEDDELTPAVEVLK